MAYFVHNQPLIEPFKYLVVDCIHVSAWQQHEYVYIPCLAFASNGVTGMKALQDLPSAQSRTYVHALT